MIHKLNQLIMTDHSVDLHILSKDYIHLFKDLYEDNICERGDIVKLELIPYDCSTFMKSAATLVIFNYYHTYIGFANNLSEVF